MSEKRTCITTTPCDDDDPTSRRPMSPIGPTGEPAACSNGLADLDALVALNGEGNDAEVTDNDIYENYNSEEARILEMQEQVPSSSSFVGKHKVVGSNNHLEGRNEPTKSSGGGGLKRIPSTGSRLHTFLRSESLVKTGQKSESQKYDSSGHGNGKTYELASSWVRSSTRESGCFNSVKRRQLERLQKRSDWFLSPPAGLRSSSGGELMQIDPTIHTDKGHFDGDVRRSGHHFEVIAQTKQNLSHNNEAATRGSRKRLKGSSASSSDLENEEYPELETRYYVVERYYGPEPRPPLSALPRISPAVCIHHPHHQQVVISLQVNQQNNIRGTVDTGINSVNPMNREVPWVSSYPIEQSTKKSALESKQRSFECIVAPDASVKSFDRQTGISMLHSPSLFMRPSEQPSKSIGTPRSPSCPGDPPWASQTTNDVVQTGPVLITNTNIGNSNNNSPRCSFAQASYTSGSILGCGPDSIPPQQQQRQQQQEHQNHSVRGLSVHFAA